MLMPLRERIKRRPICLLRFSPTALSINSRDRVFLGEGTHVLERRGKKAFVYPLFDVTQVGSTHNIVQVQQWMVHDWLVLIHINGCISWSPCADRCFQCPWLNQPGPTGIDEQCCRLPPSQGAPGH